MSYIPIHIEKRIITGAFVADNGLMIALITTEIVFYDIMIMNFTSMANPVQPKSRDGTNIPTLQNQTWESIYRILPITEKLSIAAISRMCLVGVPI